MSTNKTVTPWRRQQLFAGYVWGKCNFAEAAVLSFWLQDGLHDVERHCEDTSPTSFSFISLINRFVFFHLTHLAQTGFRPSPCVAGPRKRKLPGGGMILKSSCCASHTCLKLKCIHYSRNLFLPMLVSAADICVWHPLCGSGQCLFIYFFALNVSINSCQKNDCQHVASGHLNQVAFTEVNVLFRTFFMFPCGW